MTVRTGPGQWLAEGVATFGLLLTILGCSVRTPAAVPYAVGLYITAAYWFTASTSFPPISWAVTIARSLSDTSRGHVQLLQASWPSSPHNPLECLRRSLSAVGFGERECPVRVIQRHAGVCGRCLFLHQ